MAKNAVCQLIEQCENGQLSWETVARECLQYMSVDDVQDMAESNGRLDEEEDE